MHEEWEIWCDADGVLTHFEGLVCKHAGVSHVSEISRGKLWRTVEHYDATVGPFFEHLEKMPDADELLDFIRGTFINHGILTASGFVPKDGPGQKRRYFAREYGHDLIVKVVDKSPDKARFAHPRSILIDDRSKSIDPWVAAGGIGILHTSAKTTIAELKRIVGIEDVVTEG